MGYQDGDAIQHAVDALARVAQQLEYVWRTHYQYSQLYSFGGPTGSYRLLNPFNSPAEYCIAAVSFGDVGSVTVTTGSTAYAPSTSDTLDPSIDLAQFVLLSTAPHFIEQWQDVGPGGSITLATNISNGKNAIVCVRFRRRVSQTGFAAQTF